MNSLKAVVLCASCMLPTYVAAQTISYTYDDQDRLITQGAKTYSYDDNGDLVSVKNGSVTTTYDYDVRGSLLSVTKPGKAITYQIGVSGERIGKRVNGVFAKAWLYHNALQIVAELDAANNVVLRFVYAANTNVPGYFVKAGATYKIISDHLGSVRLVVRTSDGFIAQRIDYDPFGVVLSDSNPGFQPFGYAGGLYDPDTGLTRFGARDYDAETGRWTNKDPIDFEANDTNLYGYVFNDPINFTDPSGLEVWKCERPANIPYVKALINHQWLMTTTLEAGMGPAGGGVPGQGPYSEDAPLTPVTVNEHKGEHLKSDAKCKRVPLAIEECVNKRLKVGNKLGRWTPVNQCHTFVSDVLKECSIGIL